MNDLTPRREGQPMSETLTPTKPRCPGTRKDGSPCKAGVTSSGWCPWHDPKITEAERTGWVRKGGLASRPTVQPDALDPRFSSPEDVQRFVEETAGMVTRGDLSSDVAAVRLRAADTWMRIWESRHLRDQLEALESLVGQKLERRWG